MLSSHYFRRIATSILVLVVLFPIELLSYPQLTHAQTPPGVPSAVYVVGANVFPVDTIAGSLTNDPGDVSVNSSNFIKDTITAIQSSITAITSKFQLLKGTSLDPIAWAVAKAALQSVVNSTVKWINSGFNGSPAFATNLNSTLMAVGDAQANSFISQLTSNSAIKSPFQTQVASAVSANYGQSTASNAFFLQNPFTLGSASANPTAFLAGGSSGFAQGGWNAWLSTAMNSANNPYGATLLASNALGSQVAGAQKTQSTELNWGKGIASYRGNCQTTTTGKPTTSTGSTGSTGSVSLSPNSGCQSQNIITPGTAIESQLEKSLGSGIDTLVSAHEFDEIVSALMGQLMNQVLGSGGLAGVSKPSATTQGVAYFNQTTPSTSSTSATTAGATFTSTITSQILGLQTFQNEWNTIYGAAQAAQNALASSSCTPNAEEIITNTVQPVISESLTELSEASTSIADLNNIQAEAPIVNSDGSAVTTAQVTQASSDYSNLIASGILPSASDVQNAGIQSSDTGTSSPSSIFTEMHQITIAVQSCTLTTTPAPFTPQTTST